MTVYDWNKVILLVLIVSFVYVGESRVVQVIEVCRHGTRYPSFTTIRDFGQYAETIKSRSQLTTEGKFMQYKLGQVLRKKYWKQLFGGTPYEYTYNQTKFYVRSTNFNRTIESAQSQMMGWLQKLSPLTISPQQFRRSLPPFDDPLNKHKIPYSDSLVFGQYGHNFHPVPVHIFKYGASVVDRGQFLLSTDAQNCFNQKKWQLQNYASQFAKLVENNQDVKIAHKALQAALNKTINIWQIYKYIDNSYSLKPLHLHHLAIFNDPRYKSTFDFIHVVSFSFRNVFTEIQRKTAATDFLNEVINRMQRVVKDINTQQLILYSGHDSSVASPLAALGHFDAQCIYDKFINRNNKNQPQQKELTCVTQTPIFASNLIFQLTQNNSDYLVSVLYNGRKITLPFCDKICTLQSFKTWFQTFKVDVPVACSNP